MSAWEIGDGGPAFPVSPEESRGKVSSIHGGMTLRDYFAAHAPSEPQRWFTPAMPHPCPATPLAPPDLTKEEQEDKAGYMEGMLNVGDIRSNRLAAYFREFESWQHWKRAWDQDYAKQALIQWPYAWADAMLKARQA